MQPIPACPHTVSDPAVLWSTLLGAQSQDEGFSLTQDLLGNPVVLSAPTGSFPTTVGAFDLTYNGGGNDFIVAKVANDGQSLLWSTYIGGSGVENPFTILRAPDGGFIVAATTTSLNFPTTSGAYRESLTGAEYKLVVFKLSDDGASLLWSTFVGRVGDAPVKMVLDPSGNPIIVGSTTDTTFPVTPQAFSTTPHGGRDGFLCKLSADGTTLLWSTFFGGSGDDQLVAVDVDSGGHIAVAGQTTSTDFPLAGSVVDSTANGGRDLFVAELSPAGDSLSYATYFDGSGDELCRDLKLVDGCPVVAGLTWSQDLPTTATALQPAYGGGPNDSFVVKFCPASGQVAWCTYIGGSDQDNVHHMRIRPSTGQVLLVGPTRSSDFPVRPNGFDTTFNDTAGGADPFLLVLSADGLNVHYGSFLGSSLDEGRGDLNCSGDCDTVTVTGSAGACDYPTTAGVLDGSLPPGDGPDIVLTRLLLDYATVAVGEESSAVISPVSLFPNPVPYGGMARIETSGATSELGIFDLQGRRVANIRFGSGHAVNWPVRSEMGQPLARGVYFVRVHGQERVQGRFVVR